MVDRAPPDTPGYGLKRALDVTIALLLLIALSPLILMIACAIYATSGRPIFYRQRRLGRLEIPFQIFKFRTMRVDADKTGPAYTVTNDPRVTPVGRLLRATSLDELPQIVNVLRGDMSLMGPRPYAGFELETWLPAERSLRASLRPGISGPAQTNGRSSLSIEQIKQFDLDYARGCSFWLDCQLFVRTFQAVVARTGTN